MNTERIGKRVQEFRKRQGLTQDVLADYLDLSRSQISHIENGERKIELDKLESLANLFGIKLATFFSEDEEALETELAFAFRSDDISQEDLQEIAEFKRIVMNHQKMKKLLNEL